MAMCPRCGARLDYLSLLILGGSKTFACKRCGAALRLKVNDGWLLPYVLTVTLVALVLGLTVVLSRDFITTVLMLLVWTVISLVVYPLVLVVLETGSHFQPSPRK